MALKRARESHWENQGSARDTNMFSRDFLGTQRGNGGALP